MSGKLKKKHTSSFFKMYFKFSVVHEIVLCILFVRLSLVSSVTEPSWQDCPKNTAKNLTDCSDFGLTKTPLDIYDSSWQNM